MSRIKLFANLQEAENKVPKGTIKRLIIGKNEFSLANTSRGFKVASNFCPHRNEYLHNGSLNDFNEIICPLHQYRFNLDDGREVNDRCGFLKVFSIQVNDDGVFVVL